MTPFPEKRKRDIIHVMYHIKFSSSISQIFVVARDDFFFKSITSKGKIIVNIRRFVTRKGNVKNATRRSHSRSVDQNYL